MKPSVIVWDLETVPDLAGFAGPLNSSCQTIFEIGVVLCKGALWR